MHQAVNQQRALAECPTLGLTRWDGGNDVNDPEQPFGSIHATCLSALVTDRAMEAWYHPSIA
jgi:hypothetical protein